jgi:hypothetical protein
MIRAHRVGQCICTAAAFLDEATRTDVPAVRSSPPPIELGEIVMTRPRGRLGA